MHTTTIPTHPSTTTLTPHSQISSPSWTNNIQLTPNSSSTTSPVSTTTVLLRNNHSSNTNNSPAGAGPANDNTRSYGNSSNQLSVQNQQQNQSSTSSVNKPEKQSSGYHHNVPVQQQTQQPLPGHSFLSAVSEVKNMENALLGLLASFNSGELSAFGSGRTLETMEAIRAKQERLARLHFDLASGINAEGSTSGKDPQQPQTSPSNQQSQSTSNLKPPENKSSSPPNNQQSNQNQSQNNQNQEGSTSTSSTPWMSESDQNKLVAGLRELSVDIEKLHQTSDTYEGVKTHRGSGAKDPE